MKKYYYAKPDGLNYIELLKGLSEETGLEFNVEKRLEGEIAWDLAKTSQIAFEEVFLEISKPYLDQYANIPLIVVGGCALNILLNSRLKSELNREIFIPPNPNDCGIASGLLLYHMKPEKAVDLTYKGVSILDKDLLMAYCEDYNNVEPLNVKKVAMDLNSGKIIGIVRNTSEHGPRALGNRSIICDPTKPNMKDILNAKVKNREWYRPFAPVVRLENVSKYFDFKDESRWMSFCPKVKEEWKDKLTSITHIDGTARVQTVTRNQNEFLYDLLVEFEKINGVGVLLNTSFNVDGKPILSTFKDAFHLLNHTQMDALVAQDFYIQK